MARRASWVCVAVLWFARCAAAEDVPADTCIVDLVLPPGTETMVGGEYVVSKKLSWDGLRPGSLSTYDLKFRFSDGTTTERTVWIDPGKRYPISVQGPTSVRPSLVVRVAHAAPVAVARYSADGALLATADYGGTVVVWDTAAGSERRRMQFEGKVDSLRFTPAGTELIVVTEKEIALWRMNDGQVRHRFKPHGDHLTFISKASIHESGDLAFTFGVGNYCKLSRVADGAAVHSFRLDKTGDFCTFALFGENAETVILSANDHLRRISTVDGRVLKSFDPLARQFVGDAALTPGGDTLVGKTIAADSKRRGLAAWDAESGRGTGHVELPEGTDSTLFAGDRVVVAYPEKSGRRVECRDAKTLQPRDGESWHLAKAGRVLAVDMQHKRIVLSDGAAVAEWDLDAACERWGYGAETEAALTFPTEAGLPYLMETSDQVFLVDADSQRIIKQLYQRDDRHRIAEVGINRWNSAAFVNAKEAVWDQNSVTYGPHEIYVWDLRAQRFVGNFRPSDDNNFVSRLDVSQDGTKVLGEIDGRASVWDARTGRMPAAFSKDSPNGSHVRRAVFAADGKTVIVCGIRDDKTPLLKWWNPEGTALNLGSPLSRTPNRDTRTPEIFMVNGSDVAVPSDGLRIVALTHASGANLSDEQRETKIAVLRNDGTLLHEVDARGSRIQLGASPTLAAVGGGIDERTEILNLDGGAYLRSLPGNVTSLLVDSRLACVTAGGWVGKGTNRFIDLKSGDEVARLIRLGDGEDWIAVTPEGLFDGSENGRKQVAFRVGGSAELVPVDRFFQDFYRPGLMSAVLRGARSFPETDFAAQAAPGVVIESPTADAEVTSEQAVVTVRVEDRGGGIKGPWLMHNGVRLAAQSEQRHSGKTRVETFRVTLTPGENRLEARAASGDGSWESEAARVSLRLKQTTSRPAVHLVAVGVDKYATSTMNLRFAAADATAIAELFAQRGPALYGADRVRTLTVLDEQATTDGIRAAVESIAENCRPEDTVVVFLAGHGVTVGQRYYFIPHQLRPTADRFEDDIRRDGLPVDVLNDWIGKSSALKRVLILDTCQSGSALSLLGGGSRDPFAFRGALERLSFATGTFTLAAAPADADAQELSELKHGLLTYTLLAAVGAAEGGPLANQKLQPQGDAEVAEVREWFSYAQDKVPLLSKLYLGQEQFVGFSGQGSTFPLLPLGDTQAK